jgi:ketosteroid isomerase-like protein
MTTTTIDLDRLSRAIEERDAETQLAAYTDDAVMRVVDKNNPPSRPRVFTGKDEIGSFLADIAGRDMTHEVVTVIRDGDRLALTEDCRYPDGVRVLCSCTAELEGGRIRRQTIVQVWDE